MKLILAFLTLSLVSCSSVRVQEYTNEKPVLILEEYFNGTIDAEGVFLNRQGKVSKRFTVLIKAQWNGSKGVLDEYFTYSDGTNSRRVWNIEKTGPNKYKGTASDVHGEAIGESAGNALQWKYTLILDHEGSKYHVAFDDWMFLTSSKTMINKSVMSKFGIYLGEVILTFQKR